MHCNGDDTRGPSVPPPAAPGPRTTTRPPRSTSEKVLLTLAALVATGFLMIVAFWWFALDDTESRDALAALKDDPVRDFEPQGYRRTREELDRQRIDPGISFGGNPEDHFAAIEQEFGARGSDAHDVTRAMEETAAFAREHGYHVEPRAPNSADPSDCMHNPCTPRDQAALSAENGFVGLRGEGDRRASISIYPLADDRFRVYIVSDPGPRYVDNAADDTALSAVRNDPMAGYTPAGGTSTPASEGNPRSAVFAIRAFDVPAGKGAVPSAVAAGRAAERAGWDVDWSDPVRWMNSYPARYLSGTRHVDGVELRLEISGTEYESGRHQVEISVFGPDRPPEP